MGFQEYSADKARQRRSTTKDSADSLHPHPPTHAGPPCSLASRPLGGARAGTKAGQGRRGAQCGAEPCTGRAKVSPRPWHWESCQAMGRCSPVGEPSRWCKSHRTHAEPAGPQRTRVHRRKGMSGAGGSEEAGRVLEPRTEESRGQEESAHGRRERTPTVASGRKAAGRGASWQGPRTPPGSQDGAGIPRGHSGTWESHGSPCARPGSGDRATTGPGGSWGRRPGPEPTWANTNGTAAHKGWGSERPAKRPTRDSVAVVAEPRTGAGGELWPMGPTGGQATPGITRRWTDRRAIRCDHQPSHHNAARTAFGRVAAPMMPCTRRAQGPLHGVDRVAQLRWSRCGWDDARFSVLPTGLARPL